MGLTWSADALERIPKDHTFKIDQCKRSLSFAFERAEDVFPRQADVFHPDNNQWFADFAMFSSPKYDGFQTFRVSMQFDSLTYNWFTGLSPKVRII